MHARERGLEIGDEIGKGTGQRLATRDDDLVEARLAVFRQDRLDRGFQPAPRTVARDGDADLAAGGKSDAWGGRQARILRAAGGL